MSLFEMPAKEPQITHYELLVLVLGRFSEDQATAIFEDIAGFITSLGATITKQLPMGRRPLAFQIDHERHGTYHAFEFDCDRSQIAVLHEKLRIRKDVARFMIVKKPDLTDTQIQQYESLRANLLASRQSAAAAETPTPAVVETAAPAATESVDTPPAVEAAPASPDVTQRIDKLLADDVEV
jgi:ribosomal protein S6